MEKNGKFWKILEIFIKMEKNGKMEISREETKKILISLKETKTNFWFKFFKKNSKILTKRLKMIK